MLLTSEIASSPLKSTTSFLLVLLSLAPFAGVSSCFDLSMLSVLSGSIFVLFLSGSVFWLFLGVFLKSESLIMM